VHFGQAAMTEPPMLTVVPRFVSKPGVTTGTQSVQVAVIWHASAAGRQEMVPISASASLARMWMSPMVVEVEGAMAWSLPPPQRSCQAPTLRVRPLSTRTEERGLQYRTTARPLSSAAPRT
jgi:hypothetical protein